MTEVAVAFLRDQLSRIIGCLKPSSSASSSLLSAYQVGFPLHVEAEYFLLLFLVELYPGIWYILGTLSFTLKYVFTFPRGSPSIWRHSKAWRVSSSSLPNFHSAPSVVNSLEIFVAKIFLEAWGQKLLHVTYFPIHQSDGHVSRISFQENFAKCFHGFLSTDERVNREMKEKPNVNLPKSKEARQNFPLNQWKPCLLATPAWPLHPIISLCSSLLFYLLPYWRFDGPGYHLMVVEAQFSFLLNTGRFP